MDKLLSLAHARLTPSASRTRVLRTGFGFSRNCSNTPADFVRLDPARACCAEAVCTRLQTRRAAATAMAGSADERLHKGATASHTTAEVNTWQDLVYGAVKRMRNRLGMGGSVFILTSNMGGVLFGALHAFQSHLSAEVIH